MAVLAPQYCKPFEASAFTLIGLNIKKQQVDVCFSGPKSQKVQKIVLQKVNLLKIVLQKVNFH